MHEVHTKMHIQLANVHREPDWGFERVERVGRNMRVAESNGKISNHLWDSWWSYQEIGIVEEPSLEIILVSNSIYDVICDWQSLERIGLITVHFVQWQNRWRWRIRCNKMPRTDCMSQTDCVMTKWAHIWAVWNVVKTKSPSSHWLLDWFPFQVWECFENSGYLKNGFYTVKNCSIYIYLPLYGVLALPNKYLEPQPKLMAHGFQTSQASPKPF